MFSQEEAPQFHLRTCAQPGMPGLGALEPTATALFPFQSQVLMLVGGFI